MPLHPSHFLRDLKKNLRRHLRMRRIAGRWPFHGFVDSASIDPDGHHRCLEPRTQPLQSPVTCLPASETGFGERLAMVDPVAAPAAGLTRLHHVYLDTATGNHRVNRRALAQAFCDLNNFDSMPRLLNWYALNRFRINAHLDRGIWLGDPYLHNYYHWLIEIAPRLALLHDQTDFSDWPILLPDWAPKFVSRSLEQIGLLDRVRFLPNKRYRVDELLLLDCLSLGGEPNVAEEARFWRDQLRLETAPWPDPRSGRLLLIERPENTARALVNAQAIRELLLPLGFEVVYPEQKSWSAQVELFQQASTIVASHGAGLANLVFLRPGAHVIELTDPSSFHPCYTTLARHLGCPATLILGPSHGSQIHIEPDHLREALADD